MVPESKTTTRAAEAQYVNGVDGPQPLRETIDRAADDAAREVVEVAGGVVAAD